MKIKISSVILILILLYGVNYFLFERVLYFNELLSLLGFAYFLRTSFTNKFTFRYPNNLVYKCVLIFILLALIHAAISLYLKTTWYFYFRHLSIVYSVFSFFLGYHLYHQQFSFYSRIRKIIYGYGLFTFSLGTFGLLDRNSFTFWLVLIQKKWRGVSVLLLFFLLLLYFLSYTSLTVVIAAATLFALLVIPKYKYAASLVMLAFIGFATLFFLAIPYLKLYSVNQDFLFGDVQYVYDQHPWFNIDQNSSWRMIFWYRTVVEMFPQNLLGIGLGTPMLPYHTGSTTTDLIYNDEVIAHVIGTHNTFITVFVRLGILPIVLLFVIYRRVLKEFFTHKAYYLTNRNDGGVFLGFAMITMVGHFNLVIESPTLASLYWISLGFVSRAIYSRQFEDHALQNLPRAS